jgi:hypothetical protein
MESGKNTVYVESGENTSEKRRAENKWKVEKMYICGE